MPRRVVAAVLAAGSLVFAATTSAEASAGHGVTAGRDPFASCTAGGDTFGGVVFPATQPEVWLAHDPAHANRLVGAIQQDRWSDGGAKGLVATVSNDNGSSWSLVPLPFSACAAPYYSGAVVTDPYAGNGIPEYFDRASDPWVDTGPDGTAYTVSISFDANDNGGAVAAATSTDGGHTWTHQQLIIAENPADPSLPFSDKESVTADQSHAGRAFAVWDRLQNIACPTTRSAPSHAWSADDRVVRGSTSAATLNCYDGPAMISTTGDGGLTWSAPRVMVPVGVNEQTIANQIVSGPNGILYDVYMYIHADNSMTVEDVVSTDHGQTWGPRHVVSDSQAVGVHDPVSNLPLRTGDIIPEPAIDPSTGQLYVVWQDHRANVRTASEDALYIAASADGVRWSPPAIVSSPNDYAAFTPAVKVTRDGLVHVEYYELSHPGGARAGELPTAIVMRTSNGPGTRFTGAQVPLGPSFNMLAAPYAGGFFTGDYSGLAVDVASPTSVHTFYDAANCAHTACDAVSGFDHNGNPIPSGVADPTDVYSQPR